MKQDKFLATLFAALMMSLVPAAFAQDTTAETTVAVVPVAVDKGPEDALNRGTPRRQHYWIPHCLLGI